jgi:hypothetical protein
MSAAWETTEEDIANVLEKMCVHKNSEEINEILNNLDTDKIEREALRGDDMDEQIDLAYLEIAEQLSDLGVM